MLEFRQHTFVLPWIKFLLSRILKSLNLEEHVSEVRNIWSCINLYFQQCLQALETFCEFTHGSIVYWGSSMNVLLCQYLSIAS